MITGFESQGKTALVTGGARDIGGACAIELARAGADVCINYFNSADDAKVIQSINFFIFCFEVECFWPLFISENMRYYSRYGSKSLQYSS